MSTTTATAGTVTSLDGFHATSAAQRVDELARALFDAVNAGDPARTDAVLARSFLSYDVHGTRSRTGLKRYHSDLRRSFADLRFEVHENVGVLVEGDLVALRTIITGTHTGDYAGLAPTGRPVQTSASHIFRLRDDQFVEHWQVVDTYRILVAIGVISTGRTEDVATVAEDYIQNSGWTPDGRAAFASALAISRNAMPDGRALQTHMVTENNRLASRSVWDGTISQSGRQADFTSLDFFRIEEGLIAEHWETVDWIRVYQSFGLLSDEVKDA
jgi:hypothetical protein